MSTAGFGAALLLKEKSFLGCSAAIRQRYNMKKAIISYSHSYCYYVLLLILKLIVCFVVDSNNIEIY